MGKKRKNGEGTWGVKTIKGYEYIFYKNSSGKYFYGKNEKEVKEKIAREQRIQNTASSVFDVNAKPSTTFYNYAISYVESIKMSLQPYTYYNYTHIINNYLKNSKLGHKQLHQLTPDMFTNYYSELARTYAYGTVRSVHRILKGPLSSAEHEGLVRQFTTSKIRLPKERYCAPGRTAYVPDVNDMKRIEELCFAKNKKNDKYHMGNNGLFFITIMHTGLRISELIALHWNDVDMERRFIDVNKSASFRVIDKKQVYEEKEPKSQAGYRRIPFDDTVYNIFRYLQDNYPPEDNKKTGFVFLNTNGTHMCKSTLEQSLKICVTKKLGMDGLTPHNLRHAYSSYLASKKVNPKVIAKLMGHSKVNLTYDVYVEGYEDEMIAAANLFNKEEGEQ